MLSAIAKPFGWLMMWLYEFTSNYGLAVILFALIVKLILLPFQMKSKLSTMRTSRLQSKMKEIEKKHGANKQKYNEEIQKLYKEEGVNPMSGCLWSLIPFPILIALYQAIRFPITIMMGVDGALLAEGGAIAAKLAELGFSAEGVNAAYLEIAQSQFITDHWANFSGIAEKLRQIDYSFLGLNLGSKPAFNAIFNGGSIAEICLILIPVIAAVLSFVQSKVSTPKKNDGEEDASAQTMKGMTVVMPLITLWFAFMMPAALGVYWIASSAFAIIQDLVLNNYYGKKLAAEDAVRNADRIKREKELEEKRKETERLKAENATERNTNTSKKKLHLSERESKRGKAAEWQKKTEGTETADEPSRVGDRKYARGRAYDPNRYTSGAVAAAVVSEEAVPAEAEPSEEVIEIIEVEEDEIVEEYNDTVDSDEYEEDYTDSDDEEAE